MLKKIVIIGPESTGKSTLCSQLANHFQCSWVPEFAREYLLKNGMKYTYDDLLTIAKGQLELEDTMTTKATSDLNNENKDYPLFIDTDMYVMKVWCEFVFGKCHPYILNQIVQREYDLYLFCNIDLPWMADELREYPDLENRQKLYNMYKDILINQALPWVEISGNDSERLESAIKVVNKIL
jgi:NadR type nicotinamide-nucleotide adenylyltransferase